MKPTPQQLNIIALAIKEAILKIEACAGAGKTSTLKMVAEAIPLPSLYMAFNKVTAEEATAKFPSHVTCKTTHSLAYAAFGRPMQHKLSRPKGRYVNVAGTGSEIAKYYKLDGFGDLMTANAVGMLVRRTVERFEQSADERMTRSHVPKTDLEAVTKSYPGAIIYVFICAQKLWEDRKNLNSNVLASHDTYLKLFQLSKPNLGFEVVYLDEAQDTTPCVLDIFMNQHILYGAKLIMVGDRRQAIYQWRGAVNAMQMIEGVVTAELSHSFRYGPGIANVATHILNKDMVITGREDLQSIIGYNVVDRTKPHMYLFRTNAGLLSEAVSAIDRGQNVKIEIDVRDFIKVLESAVALHQGDLKSVKHERILPYPNFKTLKEEAKSQGGGELGRLANIVEGGSAYHILDVLSHYEAPEDATIIYTTAHKAKGREHDQVILADDFKSHYGKDGLWVGLPEFDENLLYVAATRSQRVLEIDKSIAEVLEKFGIPFIMHGDTVEHREGSTMAVSTMLNADLAELEHKYIAANYDAIVAAQDHNDGMDGEEPYLLGQHELQTDFFPA